MGAGTVQQATSQQPQQGKGSAPTGGYGSPPSGGKGLGGQLARQQQSLNPAVFDPTNSTTTQDMMGGQGMPMGQTIGIGMGLPQMQPAVGIPMQQDASQAVNAGQGQNVQLPTGDQQGWQYKQAQSAATQAQNAGTQGKGGNKVTYPATSGQQQFGQPMQSAYPNTIGQGQQSGQMKSSGKGKGA